MTKNTNENKLATKSYFDDLFSLRTGFDSFFEPFFGKSGVLSKIDTGFAPKVDIREDGKSIEISASIPGVKKEDISLELNEEVLSIKGERKDEKEEKGKGYVRKEQSYGSFYRAFRLPKYAIKEEIKSEYKDGLLEITIPKKKEEERKAKQLKIG